jgi:hypothetical protein
VFTPLLPKKHGGIGEGYSKIIAIDEETVLMYISLYTFSRQYGLEVKRVSGFLCYLCEEVIGMGYVEIPVSFYFVNSPLIR